MKRGAAVFTAIAIILCSAAILLFSGGQNKSAYLRIHIRAESNSESDQKVKYAVKEALVSFLTPIVAECETVGEAKAVIENNLADIERVADGVLYKNGFLYKSKAKINNEKFPTRTYGEFTLESGYYDALIVELGSGKGDNWWCVVYPPLCFTGSDAGYTYRSKILEIIDGFKKGGVK